jgi:hypothetical protein
MQVLTYNILIVFGKLCALSISGFSPEGFSLQYMVCDVKFTIKNMKNNHLEFSFFFQHIKLIFFSLIIMKSAVQSWKNLQRFLVTMVLLEQGLLELDGVVVLLLW